MKTLDGQVPAGYFESLPDRTLATLVGEEAIMQQGTTGTTTRGQASAGAPLAAGSNAERLPEPNDDSGLHDIRSLARSTKQRISSQRISTQPPMSGDDELASSSASWKNLALPQPAKMVALPALDELPSKQSVLAKEKAAKKERSAHAKIDATATAEPGVAKPVEPIASAAVAAAGSNRKLTFALVGAGLAAAAGAALFLATR